MKKMLAKLVVVLAAASVSSAAVWDLETDFSKTTNPVGAWSWGVYLEDGAGDFYAWEYSHEWQADPAIGYWGNAGNNLVPGVIFFSNEQEAFAFGNQWWAPDAVMLHPAQWGDKYAPLIRWTAPSDMTISVDALFYGCQNDVSTDVHVVLNGTMYNGTDPDYIPTFTGSLMDGIVEGNYGYAPLGILPTETTNSVAYNAILTLTAGDTLDFVVGYGPDAFYGGDLTGLSVTIAEVPEPATMSLLALGALAMLRRRRS
jgi:hypothetical protein